jgi:hypothetical protein
MDRKEADVSIDVQPEEEVMQGHQNIKTSE